MVLNIRSVTVWYDTEL